MGSTDVEFTYDVEDEPLVHAFVVATRRRAQKAGVGQWRSRRLDGDPPSYYIAVDGNSTRFALLAQKIERDLPIVAETVEVDHRDLRARRHLANGFVHIYATYGYGSEAEIPHLKPRQRVDFQWVPHLISYPAAPRVNARLAVTERFCVDWYFGEVPGPTMLEELHTAAELLLSFAVGEAGSQKAFSTIVAEAAKAGLFRQCVQLGEPGVASDPNEMATRLLLELKDVRREVRHRADPRADEWLRSNFFHVVYTLEMVSEAVVPEQPKLAIW